MSADTAEFERRYRADPDPWRTLTDAGERSKARRALEACGPGPLARVCDVGAGTGTLAVGLAPRCRELVALDGAPTAVAALAARLAPWPHARARLGVIPADLPDGPFDLVVASEILYYLDDDDLRTVVAWLPSALTPAGRVVAVHWTGTASDLRHDATAVHAALAAQHGLRLAETVRRPAYRLDVLARA